MYVYKNLIDYCILSTIQLLIIQKTCVITDLFMVITTYFQAFFNLLMSMWKSHCIKKQY